MGSSKLKKEKSLKMVRPVLIGDNYKYLGHFANDQFVQQGHNDVSDRKKDDVPELDQRKVREFKRGFEESVSARISRQIGNLKTALGFDEDQKKKKP